jgi:Sigma-70, region 4
MYVVPTDPMVIAETLRASAPYDEGELPEALDFDAWRSRLVEILPRLPSREADMIELYFIYGKPQADIGLILGMTGANVSHRIRRAARRMKFMVQHPMPDAIQMGTDLRFLEARDCEILMSWWRTSSQTVTARDLGYTQPTTRDRLIATIVQLCVVSRLRVPDSLFELAPAPNRMKTLVIVDEDCRVRVRGYAEYSLALWACPNIYHEIQMSQAIARDVRAHFY